MSSIDVYLCGTEITEKGKFPSVCHEPEMEDGTEEQP